MIRGDKRSFVDHLRRKRWCREAFNNYVDRRRELFLWTRRMEKDVMENGPSSGPGCRIRGDQSSL
jgi:hypothetical protein